MLDEAHAFWLRGPWRGEIRPVALPEPGSGDLVVRRPRSGVSRGTEMRVFRVRVPASPYMAMRAPFRDGDLVGTVSPARSTRRTTADKLAPALDLRRDPTFDVVVAGESRFDELPAAWRAWPLGACRHSATPSPTRGRSACSA